MIKKFGYSVHGLWFCVICILSALSLYVNSCVIFICLKVTSFKTKKSFFRNSSKNAHTTPNYDYTAFFINPAKRSN